MEATIKPIHVKGLVAGYKKLVAKFTDQYAWVGKRGWFLCIQC